MSAINLAGTVLYRVGPQRPVEYLVVNESFKNHRHWCPPKGRRVGDEDELKCAVRETLDLTGLGAADVVADEAFRAELRYVDGIRAKKVVYYLARLAASARPDCVRCDGAGIRHQWCTLEQALEKCMFQSMQNILTSAEAYIEDMRCRIHDDTTQSQQQQQQQRKQCQQGSAGSAVSGYRSSTAEAAQLGERLRRLDMGGSEQRRAQDNPRYKTKLCEAYERDGECPYHHKCVFAHGAGELRVRPGPPIDIGDCEHPAVHLSGVRWCGANPRYKTRLCEQFSNHGECPYGDKCQFAHGEGELRAGPESPRDMQPVRRPLPAQMRNTPGAERVLAPQTTRGASWSGAGTLVRHGSVDTKSPVGTPLATPTAQKIPPPASSGAGGGRRRVQTEPRGTSMQSGGKPWIKVVEVTDKDLLEMGSLRTDGDGRPDRVAEVETRLASELAATFARSGSSPQAQFKEITRVEFRNNLTKQQLLNIAVSVLLSPCSAAGVAEAVARNAGLLQKLVGRQQQDQMLLLNACRRLLAEDPNAAQWRRKAPELLGSLYSESLLDEDIFNEWFAKRSTADCGPDILAMRPFAHWLATAEEE
ncbi:hypothetical protein H4R19_001452 [Coemansia spiralis]|nr:hypothetical protein H4R19_001452 [Coemansia spiralis]